MCLSARQIRRDSSPCTATAPIPAARCARPTSARRRGSPAGATASATMAACCSSTCATTTASRRWWPTRIRRPSSWPRRCARNGWCGSTARCASVPPAPRIPELPTGAVEVYIREIEVLGPAGELPMPVFGEHDYPEEIRLKYRFLDLRREHLHAQHHEARRDHRFDPAAA